MVKKIFGAMGNLWKMFYYSPKKAETLKAVQSALNLPELKIVKPSDTRWLSHERCLCAIRKELPALITTLHQLYENSGDAEAYGLALIFSSFSGVAMVILLSEVLDLLAKLNCFMQRRSADFSRLPVMLEIVLKELELLKDSEAEWCAEVTSLIENLNEHGISVRSGPLPTRRSSASACHSINDFLISVAVPYLDALLANIKNQFSDEVVNLLVSASVFDPASLPTEEASLAQYGKKEIESLAQFYGSEAKVTYESKTYTSPPLVNKEDVITEWRVFKRALCQETKILMEKESLTIAPSLQVVKASMESSGAYTGIFPEMFKLLNILVLPVGTASVERSFSYLKLIKTRLRNRISDSNLIHLMRIAIEGPELKMVDFNEVLDIFKSKNRRIML